jgi:putative transposase
MEEDSKGTGLSNVIRIDDERVREHLGHIGRGTVEETLNAMLEAEADRLCNAERYERTQARRDQRSGSYDRKLQTTAGSVTLKVSEAAPADLRDSDHRTLSATGELGWRKR